MIKLTLDIVLKKANISRYELAKRTGIQYQIIDKYYKNNVKRYDSYVLERICDALNCQISDIIEYKKGYPLAVIIQNPLSTTFLSHLGGCFFNLHLI